MRSNSPLTKTFFLVSSIIILASVVIASATQTAVILITSHGSVEIVVTARSGSVGDIQAAVDKARSMGALTVRIPEGVSDFNASGSYRVNIAVPMNGLRIIGAGIDRTVLQMPVDDSAPNTVMFYANGKNGGRLRISGITFKGRPNIDTSPTGDVGIQIVSCKDFRIDNCSFYFMGIAGIMVSDHDTQYGIDGGDPKLVSQGVIDHCYFYDMYKLAAISAGRGWGYGVSVGRAGHYRWVVWDDDIWNILGKYDKNVFVEDCYFVGTRHAVQSTGGGVYVFRHNIVENQATGDFMTTGHPVRTNVYGMRACEIYDNVFRYTGDRGVKSEGIMVEGGGGVIFNNTFYNLKSAFGLGSCEDARNPFHPRGHTNDVWIWNNALVGNFYQTLWTWSNEAWGGCPAPVENVNYFLHEPPAERNYTPCTYPHPLTLEEKP